MTTTIAFPFACAALARLARDADRNAVTSPAALATVRRACPCGACAHARELELADRDTHDAGDDADLNPEWGLA